MKKLFKRFIFGFAIIVLLPSLFYAQSDSAPDGGAPDYSTSSKMLLLTFQASLGRGIHLEFEFGSRLTYFFRESIEPFNFGICVSASYLNAGRENGGHTTITYSRRHYISFALLPSIFIYGFHGAAGIDINFKIGGPNSDYSAIDSLSYKKTYLTLCIELGYLYKPKNNKFTFSVVLYAKKNLNEIAVFQLPGQHKTIGGIAGIRIQFGLNLL